MSPEWNHPPSERDRRCLWVVEVALPDVVAAHHDFAHRLPVEWNVAHLGIDDADRVGDDVVDALTAEKAHAFIRRKRCPAFLRLAHRVRRVRLRQTVDVH